MYEMRRFFRASPLLPVLVAAIMSSIALAVVAAKAPMKITTPPKGTTAVAGTVAPITVVGNSDVKALQIVAGNADIEMFSEVRKASSAVFNYRIPVDAIGVVNIMVIGFGDAGPLGMDSIFINVAVEAVLDSIVVYPEMIFLGPGESALLSVAGYFSDGRVRKMDHHPELTYACRDTSVASFLGRGELGAVSPGATKVVVSFKGAKKTVDVEVMP
jgi:hypothetical protein